jgi:hypothetical protein
MGIRETILFLRDPIIAETVTKTFKNFERHMLKGVSHLPFWEEPTVWEETLLRFVDKVYEPS